MGRKNISEADVISQISKNSAWHEGEHGREKFTPEFTPSKCAPMAKVALRDLGEWCTFSMNQFPQI